MASGMAAVQSTVLLLPARLNIARDSGMTPTPPFSRYSQSAMHAVPVVLLLIASLVCVWRLATLAELRFDTDIYYNALRKFEWLGMMYNRGDGGLTTPEVLFKPSSPVYKFSPLYLAWMLPIPRAVTESGFYAIYCGFQLIFALGSAFILIKAAGQITSKKNAFFTTLIVFLLSAPLYEVLRATAAENLLIFVFLLSFYVSDKYPKICGFMLAYTAMIKIYPAFMLLYFLADKQWNVAKGFLFGAVFFGLLSVILFGWQENFYYLFTVVPVLLQESISMKDLNLNLWTFLEPYMIESRIQQVFNAWRLLVLAALAVACTKVNFSKENKLIFFAIFLIVMQLMLPNYWVWYMAYLQVPVVVACCILLQRRQYLLFFLSVLLAAMVVNDRSWIDPVMKSSEIFALHTQEYWLEQYNQKGSIILFTISPLAYLLALMSAARFLLLPVYLLLFLYLLFTQERYTHDRKRHTLSDG